MKTWSKALVVVVAVIIGATVSLYIGCGSSGSTPAATTTLSAKLYSGTVGPITPSLSSGVKAATPDAPLAGYQLYCVTFSTPPLSATGTSTADGSVTLTLNAASATFGCFVLDAAGDGVATLIFTNDAATASGQTVAASGTVDFGTITVSLTTGAAQATLPSGVTIEGTPVGTTCPEGTWIATDIGHAPPCPDGMDTEGKVWVAKSADGSYALSFTMYNAGINGVCAVGSKSNIPVEVAGDTGTFTFPFSLDSPNPCPEQVATLTLTPNADCTTATLTGDVVNCGSCDPAPCAECGGATCAFSGTLTRE